MKTYGMKRHDVCGCCKDGGCIGNKYRHLRGHSRAQRTYIEKSRKSSGRFALRIEVLHKIEE